MYMYIYIYGLHVCVCVCVCERERVCVYVWRSLPPLISSAEGRAAASNEMDTTSRFFSLFREVVSMCQHRIVCRYHKLFVGTPEKSCLYAKFSDRPSYGACGGRGTRRNPQNPSASQ